VAVGILLKVTLTSEVDAVHGELDIVHRKTYAVPAVPENVDVGLAVFPNEPPDPLKILHAPVPVVGVFAAIVTVVNPQVAAPVWFDPALAVVGVPFTTTVYDAVAAVQGLLETVMVNVTVVPASPATELYVGVSVVALVKEPPPL
jgi:hypothetical protein